MPRKPRPPSPDPQPPAPDPPAAGPADRPSLRELLRAGDDGGGGLRCPACHCRDLRVVYTRGRGDRIMRRRQCRHCGRRIVTNERIVAGAPQQGEPSS